MGEALSNGRRLKADNDDDDSFIYVNGNWVWTAVPIWRQETKFLIRTGVVLAAMKDDPKFCIFLAYLWEIGLD